MPVLKFDIKKLNNLRITLFKSSLFEGGCIFATIWGRKLVKAARAAPDCAHHLLLWLRATATRSTGYLRRRAALGTQLPHAHGGTIYPWRDLGGKKIFIRLLINKFHGLSPSGGHHSLLFDQGFQKMAGWDWLERHLTVIRTPSDCILYQWDCT